MPALVSAALFATVQEHRWRARQSQRGARYLWQGLVCSRLGGLVEVVRQGVTGFLVEPGNVAELHERLAELLHDPARAQRMGQTARELVLERFTWQACAARCLAAYHEPLRESSPAHR